MESSAVGARLLSKELAKRAATIERADVERLLAREAEHTTALSGKKGLALAWRYIRAFWILLADPKAAWLSKTLAAGALVYVISPIDLIPDVIPFFGLLDDVLVVLLAVSSLRLIGPDLERALEQLDGESRREVTRPVVVYALPDSRGDLDGTIEHTRFWTYCYRTIASLEQQGLSFSGSPLPNTVYLQHPVVRRRLVALDGFQDEILAEKWREARRVMAALNAQELVFKQVTSEGREFEASAKATVEKMLKASGSVGAGNNTAGSGNYRASYEDTGSLDEEQVSALLSEAVWGACDPNLIGLIEERLVHGLRECELDLTLSTTSHVTAEAVANIRKEAKVKVGGDLKWSSVESSVAHFHVKFYPTGLKKKDLAKLNKLRRTLTEKRLWELRFGPARGPGSPGEEQDGDDGGTSP